MKICSSCKVESPNKKFGVNNSRPDNLENICKECISARRKISYSPAKAKVQWQNNKYSRPEYAESRRLMTAYGITKEFRDYMAQVKENRCEICNEEVKLVVDHDHKTGIVRGMLCSTCNRGLGHFNDDANLLTKAFMYIKTKTEQNNVEFN